MGDELRRARRELRRGEAQLERRRAGPGYRPGRAAAAEVDRVENLRRKVDDLERTQTARDEWWDQTEDVRSLALKAHEELSRRQPESDLDAGPALQREPEEVLAAMTPEERARHERNVDAAHERQRELSLGPSVGGIRLI